MLKTIFGLGCALFLAFLASTASLAATLSSPDKSISVSVETDNDGRVTYSITRRDKLLIAPSHLGFLLTDSYAMVRGFALESEETASGDDVWEQPWGERRYPIVVKPQDLIRFRPLCSQQI